MVDPTIDDGSTLGGGTTRRRYLTIVFSDLCGSTRLATTMEAEHYGEVLAALREVYVSVVPRHGGTVVRIQGDGVLAIFGVPDAREDDGRRATEAALELHARVAELRFVPPLPGQAALALHTGIHAGLVLLDVGDLVRGRFDLVGDAPNIAARLSDVADAGEILVSAGTLGPEHHFFRTGALRHLSLKGRTEPIAVYPILAHAPVGTRFEARSQRGLAPFVGRRDELRVLERRLDAVLAGQAVRLAVAAPAGQGKTRLVDEFLRRAATLDCQIHRGYCESYLSAEPLQPFLQMLRHLFRLHHGMSAATATLAVERTLAEIDPLLLRHRGELLRALSLDADADDSDGAETGGAARRNSAGPIAAVLRDLFDALAAAEPVVLFIDDWQWADDATRLVVDAISTLSERAVLLLTAVRATAADAAGLNNDTPVLELLPFSDAEATDTIACLLPRIDPFVQADIRRYAGGNPLFLEELCHSAAHGGGDRRLGRPLDSDAWLHVLIESRVARLAAPQAELVRTAAVIGNVIPAWLLETLTGCAADHPLVRGLADQDFIFPGEQAATLRFKHGIARDVIYNAVGLHQRRALHLQVAEALRQQGSVGAQDEILESLAYHYGAGGQPADAAQYAELAGDKALAASALDRAQSQFRAALTALDQLPASEPVQRRWNAIAQRFGLVCVFDPSSDQLGVLRRAVERAELSADDAALARAQHWLGYVHYALGDAPLAIRHGERALAVAGRIGDSPLQVQIRATLGQSRAAAADYEQALPLLDEAIAVKQRHRSGSRPAVGLSYTLACKAAVLGDRGLFAQAHDCFDEALAVVHGAGHEVEASVLGWRSAVYLWQGRWNDALRVAVAAQQVAERVKSQFIFAADRALAAYARWSLTREPAALQSLTDATAWLEAGDRRLAISLYHGYAVDALAANGQFDAMRGPAAQALLRARRRDHLGQAMTYRALARAAAAGHGAGTGTGNSSDADGDSDIRRTRSTAHYLALALAAARARGSRHEVAVTQLCDAELGAARRDRDRSRIVASLDQAEAGFDAMQMVWHLERAEALRRSL